MAAAEARRRGDTPPAETRGSAEGSRPGPTLACKSRTKTFLVCETFEVICQASFSRNLPEEAPESNECKPAEEEAEVPTPEPGRGRPGDALRSQLGRRRQVRGAHRRRTDARGVRGDSRLTFRPGSRSGRKGAFFLSLRICTCCLCPG